jgi:hypothetical protein
VVDDLSWILQYFSHLDSQLDRVINNVACLKMGLTAVEKSLARTDVAVDDLILSIAGVNSIDGIEARFDRIERRLDLAELPY